MCVILLFKFIFRSNFIFLIKIQIDFLLDFYPVYEQRLFPPKGGQAIVANLPAVGRFGLTPPLNTYLDFYSLDINIIPLFHILLYHQA